MFGYAVHFCKVSGEKMDERVSHLTDYEKNFMKNTEAPPSSYCISQRFMKGSLNKVIYVPIVSDCKCLGANFLLIEIKFNEQNAFVILYWIG